jgi:WD40 repeat protein
MTIPRGTVLIAALIAACIWQTLDPEVRRCPLLLLNAAGAASTRLPAISVSRMYWSADGREILSFSRGQFDALGRLALHDAGQSNGCIPVNVMGEAIHCAALAPDGRHVLYGTDRGRLNWMDLESGDPVTLVALPPREFFTAVAIADDGQHVAGATAAGSICVVETDGRNSVTLRADWQSSIADVRFSRDGAQLVSARLDGGVTVWDLAAGRVARELAGHGEPAMAAAFLPGGNRIVSGGLDDTIRIWDVSSGRELWRGGFGLRGVRTIAVSPDGSTAAVGGFSQKIVVCDLERRTKKYDIATPAPIVIHLNFSSDGTSLGAAGLEAMIRLYDVQTGAEQNVIDLGHDRQTI